MPENHEEPTHYDNEYETLVFEEGQLVIDDNAIEQRVTERELERAFPGYWVSKHDDILYDAYTELKDQSAYSALMDSMNYGDFCTYMEYVHYNDTTDVHKWNLEVVEEYSHKSRNCVHPSFKRWVRHNLNELFNLHCFLNRMYSLNFGGFEVFMDFVYDTSSSRFVLPGV